ncbi:hypothetical protein NHG22_24910 [Streptomyces sp. ATE26]|uniref:aromatic-ring hydroxylase C-terminal domain-containing protein n=1 Tax=Streptomyces sp. ATE26 TaxID=2954237 RepID=UPI002483031D|nr:hypothetical protein [Streptomyces sp. ATE26]MDI1457023.1 hypothetical protein [Streptomyces sp. ATE26]
MQPKRCPHSDHPWLGCLAPDLALTTGDGPTRLAGLLTAGRGLLLDLTAGSAIRESAAGWADRVDIVTATCPDHPELHAILLRPDGHTAWLRTAGHDHVDGLHQALQYWPGPAAPSDAARAATSP